MSHTPQFQIFKAGLPVTSMEGAVVSFGDDELRGIAERYDPKLHEAPLIIGHPQHDAPAYGWVRGLSFSDGALAVEEHQVDQQFDELRKQGRFKKVSARFYTPTSKNNPTPGEYYLRDVGFLGAMAPAVKGLRSASFGDEAGELVTAEVSFADLPAYAGSYIGSLFRGLRDFLIEKFDKDTADKVLPDWQVQNLNDMSVRAEARDDGLVDSFADNPNPNPKEKTSMKTPEQLQAEVDAANRERDAANARATALENADRERVTLARHQENVSFADGLVASSRWPAGAKDVLVATLDHLATPAAAEDKVVSFGDGDAAKPLHQVLRDQLQQLPEQVSFAEFAGKGSGGSGNDDASAVAAKATSYQAEQARNGNQITTAEAVRHVSAKS